MDEDEFLTFPQLLEEWAKLDKQVNEEGYYSEETTKLYLITTATIAKIVSEQSQLEVKHLAMLMNLIACYVWMERQTTK